MSAKRENLVFVRAGKSSLHRQWFDADEYRNWDLQIITWEEDPSIAEGSDLPLSVDKGTKWDSIYRYLAANPQVMDDYRYIAFMDDDVLFEKGALNRYFDICKEEGLRVAQPSLHHDSYFCYSILLHCPHTKLRYSNFVECMAAAIHTDYLRSFMPRMAKVQSGWGMDRIWTVTMPDPCYKSAIIDEIVMLHTRPHATGVVYKAFADGGVTPKTEMDALINSYSDIPRKMLVYGAKGVHGDKLNASSAQLVNGRHLLANAWRYREPRRAAKTGAGMLLRAVTEAQYLPVAAHRLKTETL